MSFNTETSDLVNVRPQEIVFETNIPGEDLTMPSTVPDFARKLFKSRLLLLEDPANGSIISWSSERDSFTVMDVNTLSNTILPRVFNHGNFSSFVRQLNKYDFHKVRKTSQDLHPTWTFRHPHFHGDRPGDLKYIMRKAVVPQSEVPRTEVHGSRQEERLPKPSSSYSPELDVYSPQQAVPTNKELLDVISRLEGEIRDLRSKLRTLERYSTERIEYLESRVKSIEAAIPTQQSNHPTQQDIEQGPHDNLAPGVFSRSGHPGIPTFEQGPPMLQSPSNLPPGLFTHSPLNISGGRRDSQQGNTSSLSSYPSSSTAVMMPPSANLISPEAPYYREDLFANVPAHGGHEQYDEGAGYQNTSELLPAEGSSSYFPVFTSSLPTEEDREGHPWARATKRLRISQARHSWPSNLNRASGSGSSMDKGPNIDS
ncbi:Transcription factor SKN7 [Psilocybe cubensis]|uniref:Transcription factor SKN7 n=2 Tax=Psilocybe cubensis TaxID=181762 RepID=A0ACB8GR33_PSICU|nr:Transcription factor SKN7 [Psilocybe cubensis]KAH9477837.1 Transcription factor SKN7 [Psilocybe cubensis]